MKGTIRDSQSWLQNMASGWLQGWLLVKLQVEAPPEELQSFKVASAFGSFTIQEPKLSGWSEAMAEATLKPCFEASSDCPYYKQAIRM
jgi:hypothetical protein